MASYLITDISRLYENILKLYRNHNIMIKHSRERSQFSWYKMSHKTDHALRLALVSLLALCDWVVP